MKKLCLLLTVLLAMNVFGSDKQKIIFDCDLGDDIDDAYALALVLASPEFEVLGFVMDYGNTPERAKVACKMLYETGREDIPVVVGRNTKDHHSKQFDWAKNFSEIKPIEQPAADFIIEYLNKYPNEIILFTVGPVPNMLDVIQKDPEALKLAKRVYSMFGSFYMGYDESPALDREWNVVADVEASKVFTTSGLDIVYAGLDITTYVKLLKDKREQLWSYDSPLMNSLKSLYELWGHGDPTLFDVVAVGMVLWPELFVTRKAFIKVTDEGYTVLDESKDPNCEIGMDINKDEFLKRVMERYLKQNLRRE